MKTALPLILVLALLSLPALADERTVTLSIPDMNCPACPFTVRTALEKVEGVLQAKVQYEKRQAIVTFDTERTSVKALTRATTDAGYPSNVQTPQKPQD